MNVKRHFIDTRVSIALPEDWEILDPSDDQLLIAAAPEDGPDRFRPQLFVTRTRTDHEDPRECVATHVGYLNELTEYVVSGAARLTINGRVVISLTYDQRSGHTTFTHKRFFLIVDGQQYAIACKMLPEQADRWVTRFDTVAKSLGVG